MPHWFYFVGLYMLGGVFFFFMFLVSNFLLIYDYEILHYYMYLLFVFEIKIFLFFFTCIFFHTCGYAFCLSVSGNIQVDSIKLLSTLATDG